MARVVKVSSLHFSRFYLSSCLRRLKHSLIFILEPCSWQKFMRFVFESVICRFSFIWRVMSFVRSFWFHFRSPASCSFRSVAPNQWDLSNPKLYPHYTEYMWLLETLKTSIYWFILKVVVFLISSHRRLCVTHVFFRKMKSNALILGTSFLQLVPLSEQSGLWST